MFGDLLMDMAVWKEGDAVLLKGLTSSRTDGWMVFRWMIGYIDVVSKANQRGKCSNDVPAMKIFRPKAFGCLNDCC